MTSLPRYHDFEEDSIGDQLEFGSDDMRAARPRWYRHGPLRLWGNCLRWWPSRSAMGHAKRRRICAWIVIAIVVLTLLGVIAGLFVFFSSCTCLVLISFSVYISLVSALIHRLAPPAEHSGLQHIVEHWEEPDKDGAHRFEWRDDFSRDIVPKDCHSHNDYWRRVPLYNALAAGCTSVEADIWLTDDNELLVSHSWRSTTQYRTLQSLYLDPLSNILSARNATLASTEPKETGIFDADPTVSTILLIDLKTSPHLTWPVLISQLQPLRDRDWLTYYNGSVLHRGPLTIVGTGNTPFSLVQEDPTNRFVFFDAPLLSIADERYNTTNSYYASVEMKKAIGRLWFDGLSAKQEGQLAEQIQAADEKGLKSRYWGEPRWPISLRDRVWSRLMELGVGVLNVDDLVSATRWNWGWCVVAGLVLCGNS